MSTRPCPRCQARIWVLGRTTGDCVLCNRCTAWVRITHINGDTLLSVMAGQNLPPLPTPTRRKKK